MQKLNCDKHSKPLKTKPQSVLHADASLGNDRKSAAVIYASEAQRWIKAMFIPLLPSRLEPAFLH